MHGAEGNLWILKGPLMRHWILNDTSAFIRGDVRWPLNNGGAFIGRRQMKSLCCCQSSTQEEGSHRSMFTHSTRATGERATQRSRDGRDPDKEDCYRLVTEPEWWWLALGMGQYHQLRFHHKTCANLCLYSANVKKYILHTISQVQCFHSIRNKLKNHM